VKNYYLYSLQQLHCLYHSAQHAHGFRSPINPHYLLQSMSKPPRPVEDHVSSSCACTRQLKIFLFKPSSKHNTFSKHPVSFFRTFHGNDMRVALKRICQLILHFKHPRQVVSEHSERVGNVVEIRIRAAWSDIRAERDPLQSFVDA
jgi:hypothetical protein